MAASSDKNTSDADVPTNWDLVYSKLRTKFPQVGDDVINAAAGDADALAEAIAEAAGMDSDFVRTQVDAVLAETSG